MEPLLRRLLVLLIGLSTGLCALPAGAHEHAVLRRQGAPQKSPRAAGPRGVTRRPVGTPPGVGLPLWSDSFKRGSVTYSYTMVGRDPKLGAGTTTVRALIVPIRFVFDDPMNLGTNVFDAGSDLVDGQTAVEGILRSPIFTPYPFRSGSQDIGTTQFGDAYIRADFWNDMGARRSHHVLLEPHVASTLTIQVPPEAGQETCDNGRLQWPTATCEGVWRPLIDEAFFNQQVTSRFGEIGATPDTLVIFVTGPVLSIDPFFLAGGAHWSTGPAPDAQTWLWASYSSHASFGGGIPDATVLGHEVLEWLNDPFDDNDVPGWSDGPVRTSDWCDGRFLEVADPLSNSGQTANIPFPVSGYTYHLPDAVFLDWFTHKPSRSIGKLYSLFGSASAPSAPCIGDTVYETTVVDIAGAVFTEATAINDKDDLVGFFVDQGLQYHAFAREGGHVMTFDVPGAVGGTKPTAINDLNQIAGIFSDGVQIHGFLRTATSTYRTIDVPGALATFPASVNRSGDIVGQYVDAVGFAHGFLFRNDEYTTIDVPSSVQSAVTGLNARGDMTIVAGDANGAVTAAYRQAPDGIALIQFPGDTFGTFPVGIDNRDQVAGVFFDPDGYLDGFFMREDGTYLRLPYVDTLDGMNNRGQMVGVRDGHAVVMTIPESGADTK